MPGKKFGHAQVSGLHYYSQRGRARHCHITCAKELLSREISMHHLRYKDKKLLLREKRQTLIDITKWPPAFKKYEALSAKILACKHESILARRLYN